MVKGVCCSYRGPEFSFQNPQQVIHNRIQSQLEVTNVLAYVGSAPPQMYTFILQNLKIFRAAKIVGEKNKVGFFQNLQQNCSNQGRVALSQGRT